MTNAGILLQLAYANRWKILFRIMLGFILFLAVVEARMAYLTRYRWEFIPVNWTFIGWLAGSFGVVLLPALVMLPVMERRRGLRWSEYYPITNTAADLGFTLAVGSVLYYMISMAIPAVSLLVDTRPDQSMNLGLPRLVVAYGLVYGLVRYRLGLRAGWKPPAAEQVDPAPPVDPAGS